MKNVLAVIGTIIIVAACAYGIYKQVEDFNKKIDEEQVASISQLYESSIC